jgi:hypothetical protein
LPVLLQGARRDLGLYNRTSSYSLRQAGPALSGLQEKTEAARRALEEIAPDCRVVKVWQGVEQGKMSKRRPCLEEAAEYARHAKIILVALDRSRFIRPEAYDYLDPDTYDLKPTAGEWDLFRALTRGCRLATILHPATPFRELHSKRTKQTGKAGRPRKVDYEKLFAALGPLHFDRHRFRLRWQTPIAEVAAAFGVGPMTIQDASWKPARNGRTYRLNALAAGAEDFDYRLVVAAEDNLVMVVAPRGTIWCEQLDRTKPFDPLSSPARDRAYKDSADLDKEAVFWHWK